MVINDPARQHGRSLRSPRRLARPAWEADNGGTVLVPLLSTVASLNLTLDGAASRINTAQLANVGTLNVYAQNGAVVDLSGVTSYTGFSAVNTTIDATGSGSSIDLANLTVFHGANDGNVVSLWANQGDGCTWIA